MLDDKYLSMIKKDPELQGLIAKATNRSVQSVLLWVKKNNSNKLLLKPVLRAISDYLGVRESDLLK